MADLRQINGISAFSSPYFQQMGLPNACPSCATASGPYLAGSHKLMGITE
jgi:hypothetical protein